MGMMVSIFIYNMYHDAGVTKKAFFGKLCVSKHEITEKRTKTLRLKSR